MKKIAEALIIVFTSVLLLPLLSPLSVMAGVLNLQFDGEKLSANLDGVSLRTVCEKISKEKGIWFRGGSSSVEQNVSVHFSDLPLEKALKRIVANTNHSLVFDKDETLLGVIIISHRGPGFELTNSTYAGTKESISSSQERRLLDSEETRDVEGGCLPGRPMQTSEDDAQIPEVARVNAKPGELDEMIPEQPEEPNVIENYRPPNSLSGIVGDEADNF